jgi:hypothetical protein
MVRIPGVCNFDPATTVLAHLRMLELGAGTGFKSHDLFAAHACSACHDEVDRRTHQLSFDEARNALIEGVLRTQAKLIEEGVIHVG